MSDEKLAPVLSSWLKSRDIAPPDATRSAAHVMARVSQTRQRGRWWPLPSFGRVMVAPAGHRGTVTPLVPIPARNGQTSSVTGRTRLMFSPVKAMLIGAFVFALGGVLFIAQPFDRQGTTAPAAPAAESASSPGEWTAVTGTAVCSLQTPGTWQREALPYGLTGRALTCIEIASDPRVAGTSTVVLGFESWDPILLMEDPANSVSWSDYTLQGPEGTWTGQGYGFYDTDGTAHNMTIATGSGAYEGLTYMQSITVPAGTANPITIGLIQSGSLPPGFPVMPFSEATPASE